MSNDLIPFPSREDGLALAARIADQAAASGTFEDFRSRRALGTIRRQAADLRAFADYLDEPARLSDGAMPKLGEPIRAFADALSDLSCPLNGTAAWAGITFGLVRGFVSWLLDTGYAVGTVNNRLATIKVYAELAFTAGIMTDTQYNLIRTVKGYRLSESKRTDEKRTQTRRGLKKATATKLTREQVERLKVQPDTPQGRRDALLICLLADHGLRCSEVALLQVATFDLSEGTFSFYRPKVDKQQQHRLTPAARRALEAYLKHDAPVLGFLIVASRKNSQLDVSGKGVTVRGINGIVGRLGETLGIMGLSPHDLRHFWATRAAKQSDPFALQEAGGWNSLAMPRRYIDNAKIANEGIVLE